MGAPSWWRRRWGVRAASALSAAAFVAVSLAVAGLALVVLQDRAVRAGVEDQVQAQVALVAGRLELGETPAAAVRAGSSGFAVIQILAADGSVLAASPQLTGVPPIQPGRVSLPLAHGDVEGIDIDDGPLLVVARAAATPSGPRLVLAGGSLAAAEQSARSATQLALLGVPLLTLVAGAATYAFTGRALRPVEAIRSDVAELTDRDLARRVVEPAARDEIGRLARTMNDMLARLEAAQSTQRRFVADASHELRSPLATIIARLELGLYRGAADEDMAVMLPEAQRMARLIEDLLLLARADERGLLPRRDEVDLDELVEAEVGRHRETGGVRVHAETTPVRVIGDRAQLGRVIRNLVDNATRYAADRVVVRLRAEAATAVIEVVDNGPGIPPGERMRVFERFVRLDDGRARAAGGTGLGLAIVAEVIGAHGGQVEAGAAPGGGALVRVSLPVQAGPAAGLRAPASPPRSVAPASRMR